jgi:hypothetical protein
MIGLDLEPMAVWLAGALAPEWGMEELEHTVNAGDGVLVSDGEGVAIGAAVALVGAFQDGAWSSARPSRASGRAGRGLPAESNDVACVPFISIEPSRRFRGLGGEAGLELERHLRHKLGVERVYAPVPDGRGLAVYFWLRLGFRPLTRSEAPWPLVGLGDESGRGIWMVSENG